MTYDAPRMPEAREGAILRTVEFQCYTCASPAWRQCPRCRAVFCPDHGDETCLRCGGRRRRLSLPRPALVSSGLFRGSLLAAAVVGAIQFGPGLMGVGSSAVATPAPTRLAAPATLTPASTPTATPRPSPTSTPTPTPTATASPSPTATPPPPTPTPRPKAIPYVVRPGDSLRSIADRFGLSAETLAAYNGITDPDLIRVGQTIQIPQ
ncbi:MAG: LysM peptidoglycan-binding domain-containing protein [Chloroflexi bacterium]|nr:LysM peptidoglycan-binding domain-containing protein [Chloroflexota bacterium]